MTSAVAKTFSRTTCRHCGGTSLTWQTSIINRSAVQQGRLNTHDVECVFVLGCDDCSETMNLVDADRVAALLNEQAAERRAATAAA